MAEPAEPVVEANHPTDEATATELDAEGPEAEAGKADDASAEEEAAAGVSEGGAEETPAAEDEVAAEATVKGAEEVAAEADVATEGAGGAQEGGEGDEDAGDKAEIEAGNEGEAGGEADNEGDEANAEETAVDGEEEVGVDESDDLEEEEAKADGFGDQYEDMGEYGEGDEGDESGSEYEDMDDQSDEEERSKQDLQQAMEEKEHLMAINRERHKKILLFWEKDKYLKKQGRGGGVAAEEKLVSGQNSQNTEQIQAQYIKTLDQLNILWDKLDQKRENAEEKIDRLTTKLDRQDEKATELSDSFKAFKREIAREARHSRTGKPVKLKRILAFEASEESKDREVAEVRLKHINLLNQLKQLEDQVKEKEELAEGLHLIDFEQLKIENQTLNEKIEERNDELHKLRKKTTTTVQVLTHIKEKLQFVQQENKVLDSELGVLETSVAALRDRLTKAKKVRDALRNENAELKQKQGFIGSDLLVSDFEGRKGKLEHQKHQVNALKSHHAKLLATVERAHRLERQYGTMSI